MQIIFKNSKKFIFMERFRFVDDLTSDVMIEVYGRDLKELFENAALGMFSVICQIPKIKPEKVIEIEVRAESLEDLMIAWLQELIARVDIDGMFFSKFEVLEVDENHLKAKVYGEEAKPEKGGTLVKAVTYYKYKFEKSKNGYKVRVAFDI